MNKLTGQPRFQGLSFSRPQERERSDKKRDSGNEDTDRNFFPFTIVVMVSSGANRNNALQNSGSIFLQMKALSNSLWTGMDKLDGDKEVLPPPKQKPSRSVGTIIPILKA